MTCRTHHDPVNEISAIHGAIPGRPPFRYILGSTGILNPPEGMVVVSLDTEEVDWAIFQLCKTHLIDGGDSSSAPSVRASANRAGIIHLIVRIVGCDRN